MLKMVKKSFTESWTNNDFSGPLVTLILNCHPHLVSNLRLGKGGGLQHKTATPPPPTFPHSTTKAWQIVTPWLLLL